MATSTLNPADATSWWDWVTNYDQTLANFQTAYANLVAMTPWVQANHPEMLAQHNALVQEGNQHLQELNDLKATRDYVYSWLNWLWSGASNVANFVGSEATSLYNSALTALGLQGLGIAPVVAVAGVAAAAAVLVAIGYWIQKAVAQYQRESFIQQQESQGVAPQDAINQANQTFGSPVSTSGADNLLGIPWNYVILGVVAIFVLPPLVDEFLKAKRT